ncbi:MAG: hypothetical protein WBE76_29655 [Terracidiphilus sp.]
MMPRLGFTFHVFHLGLLRAASLLTPHSERAEWWREWRSELWHVRRQCAPLRAVSWQAEREVTAFCLGAFRDALCLRRHAPKRETPAAASPGAPAQCLLWMALLLAASFAVSLLLPGIRAANDASRYPVNPNLILIQHALSVDGSKSTVSFAELNKWKLSPQRSFDGFAFYSIAKENIATDAGDPQWTVAHASANLFSVLGLPVRLAASGVANDTNLPAAILSCTAFEREFEGNPRITGTVLRVGRQFARIAGVAPCGAWRLPGKVDAWLLEPDSALAQGAAGYVVAHLTSYGESEMYAPDVPITAYESSDSESDLFGIAIESHVRGPMDLYLFALLLAFLCLPAVTSVSMSEYSFNSHRPPWPRRLCRASFLGAKIALLVPIVYYVPLDLAWWRVPPNSFAPQYIQLIASYLLCLFGMRWILLDQRQRCPVCLRRVTHPAQVGHASRTFLSWNGTELICMGGHTLLHVPGLPTSWFSTQRWLYLDASWDFLFAGSGVQKAPL